MDYSNQSELSSVVNVNRTNIGKPDSVFSPSIQSIHQHLHCSILLQDNCYKRELPRDKMFLRHKQCTLWIHPPPLGCCPLMQTAQRGNSCTQIWHCQSDLSWNLRDPSTYRPPPLHPTTFFCPLCFCFCMCCMCLHVLDCRGICLPFIAIFS